MVKKVRQKSRSMRRSLKKSVRQKSRSMRRSLKKSVRQKSRSMRRSLKKSVRQTKLTKRRQYKKLRGGAADAGVTCEVVGCFKTQKPHIRNGKECSYIKKEKKILCLHDKMEGIDFCSIHTCETPDCNKEKSSKVKFCDGHLPCKVLGCFKPTDGHVKTDNTCNREGNLCPHDKMKGSNFCSIHTCETLDCNIEKSSKVKFCDDHRVENAYELPVPVDKRGLNSLYAQTEQVVAKIGRDHIGFGVDPNGEYSAPGGVQAGKVAEMVKGLELL
jgi:hypothetical protein